MIDLSRRTLIGSGLALVGLSAAPLLRSGPGHTIPAQRFTDSVGICTHPNWRNNLWTKTNWQADFLNTGALHTRGKIGSHSAGNFAASQLRDLFARGVKICALVADQKAGLDRVATKANIDFLAEVIGAHNLSGIESANEYNSPTRKSASWSRELREFQKWLHDVVRANPKLDGIPLIAPSIWGRLPKDYRALGNLEPNVDRGCLHHYTGGRRPTESVTASSSDEGGGGFSIGFSLDHAIQTARILAPSKPLWITEFGYPVAGPDLPLSNSFITEEAAAKYILRGLFDAFALGVEKTFIYALLDDVHRSPPRYHGLIDGQGRPRQAFHAVKNLMAIFADVGEPSSSGTWHFNLSASDPTIKSHLFRKNDGSYLVSVYRDVESYDRFQRRDRAAPPVLVTLNFSTPASKVEVFAPTYRSAPSRSEAQISRLTTPVSDDITIVKIMP